MKRIFVIGGMGSGKSSVSALLAAAGLPVIDLDKLGHKALESAEAKAALVQAFGEDVLDAQGAVNRKALAAKAFATPESTRLLNSLQLPRIKALLDSRIEDLAASGARCAVVEYSAYAPAPDEPFVGSDDLILAVVAPLQARLERLLAAGWGEDDARARIARQITDEQRIACADFVIRNDGDKDTLQDRVRACLAWLDCQ